MNPARSLIFAAMLVAGCHQQQPSDQALLDPTAEAISIKVINRNRLDAEIYIAHDSHRDRLGLAIASTTTEFSVPLRVFGAGREYRLIGEPVGAHMGITTETLHAQPGDEVTWQLEDSFARSSVVVH
ncbi:MAG TPA: hypothetical protein VFP26_00995 [Gemmatimonadaceae bacterium]|jgi:hypothetical protein|nr:hypothetical protein [Gemmatimonadaceae bacterium]